MHGDFCESQRRYRTFNDQAMSRIARPPKEQVKHWFSSFVRFCKALYELEKKYEVFAENPLYSLEVLKKIFAWTLNQTRNARQELDSEEIYKVLHDEFSKASSSATVRSRTHTLSRWTPPPPASP